MRSAPQMVCRHGRRVRCPRLLVIATALALVAPLVRAAAGESAPPKQPSAAQGGASTAAHLTSLRQQAEQGDAKAQCRLATNYMFGLGIPPDLPQAAAWYRKAAEQGYAEAQRMLGMLYTEGLGVARDEAQAIAWLRKAADLGDAPAQHLLGMKYAEGQGVPQDGAQAVAWVVKAAEQGDALAQHNLSIMYAEGRGVPRDDVEAYKWRTISAARASALSGKEFADLRDELARKMTPDQIAEAQKRAREWTAAFDERKK